MLGTKTDFKSLKLNFVSIYLNRLKLISKDLRI